MGDGQTFIIAVGNTRYLFSQPFSFVGIQVHSIRLSICDIAVTCRLGRGTCLQYLVDLQDPKAGSQWVIKD